MPADPDTGPSEALSLLGLAKRAGRTVVGTKAVREAARKKTLALSLVASDAGDNARQRVVPLFDRTTTRWVECGTAKQLGRAVGRDRAIVVGVADERLASRIVELLGEPAVRGPEGSGGGE